MVIGAAAGGPRLGAIREDGGFRKIDCGKSLIQDQTATPVVDIGLGEFLGACGIFRIWREQAAYPASVGYR
jgi:hypothetical protein